MRAAKQLVATRDADAREESAFSNHWVPNERYGPKAVPRGHVDLGRRQADANEIAAPNDASSAISPSRCS